MKRRTFFTLGLSAGIGAILSAVYWRSGFRNILRTAYRWTLPDAQIAEGSEAVSVEKVLNSRCNSDSGGDPYKFHWGMFDSGKKLPGEVVQEVITLSCIPRLTDRTIKINKDSQVLSFVVPKEPVDEKMSLLMVESGMQQQAVGLTCAALGVGMVFDNRGRDGTVLSDTEFETTKIRLGPMKPGYDGSYWTKDTPEEPSPWMPGNLPVPERKGSTPFFSALAEMETQKKTSRRATEQALSQLLWAARGRTPHFYLSKPWGMTIPTWTGKQTITSVYVVKKQEIYKYTNWAENRPTHTLDKMGEMKTGMPGDIKDGAQIGDSFIVLGKNEHTNKALWEVGYQLFNLLIQAASLDISYQVYILDNQQRKFIEKAGIKNPVIGFAHF